MAIQVWEHIPVTPDLQDRLVTDGLVSPSLYISDVLRQRMQRNQRALSVDQINLEFGLRAIETECPTTIYFDSLPKGTDSADPVLGVFVDHRPGEIPAASIRVKPVLSELDESQGALQKLNETFWLGVLATQTIAEGYQGKLIDAERKKNKLPILSETLVDVGGMMAPGLVVAEISHSFPLILISMFAGRGASAQIVDRIKQRRGALRSKAELLLDSLRPKATEIATSFPAVKPDFELGNLQQ